MLIFKFITAIFPTLVTVLGSAVGGIFMAPGYPSIPVSDRFVSYPAAQLSTITDQQTPVSSTLVLQEINQQNTNIFPTGDLPCCQFSSTSVCCDSSQPDRRFLIQAPHQNQVNRFPSIPDQSAPPNQSRHVDAPVENRHPVQPIVPVRPRQGVITPHPSQAEPQDNNIPIKPSAPGSASTSHCSLMVSSDISVPAFRLTMDLPCSVPTSHGAWLTVNQTTKPQNFPSTQTDLKMASNQKIFIKPSSTEAFLPFNI